MNRRQTARVSLLLIVLVMGVMSLRLASAADVLPAAKSIAMANELLTKGNTDAAFEEFRSALRAADSIDVRRAYGDACYTVALKAKAEHEPKLEPKQAELKAATEKAYKKVTVQRTAGGRVPAPNGQGGGRVSSTPQGSSDYMAFDPDYPPMIKAKRELEAIQHDIDKANALLTEAISQFRAVLRLAPGNKDVQATARIALSTAAHPLQKGLGKTLLHDFIAKYATTTDAAEKALLDECSKTYEAMLK